MERHIKKWEDLDSVETIYKCIRFCELDMGEDFLDRFESIVNDVPFATYLMGKGIINSTQFNKWMNEKYSSVNSLMIEYDCDYSIMPLGEATEEGEFKKYHILADYIYQVDNLRKRLFNVITTRDYDGDIDVDYGVVDIILTEDYYTSTGGRFETVHDEWLWVESNSIETINTLLAEREGKEDYL